ncbi:MAG: anaerobic ribonucleoside-triphosphate reductase activating protein [Clostridiales bacterium GWF2_36_10]|nr:MAG: anaerobic ribonucleoside-triphosphate reductase activating protein [Clostridiales bacterium GWF2_36_10]HAN21770.1 anaerobic ribonucleoside-triphosphate reductase activating protein [Clostridiales bacterium]
MIIGGIQKTSTIDFPGVLSCVLFCRGCDLNCFYCHNRDLIYTFGKSLDDESVWSFLKKRKGLLDGVVISGGEPTLQKDLGEFISEIKKLDYKIKLDTNGQNPKKVKELCDGNLLDYSAIDIKATLFEYPTVCGSDGFLKATETVDILDESKVPYEIRTTLYPGLTIEGLEHILSSMPIMPRWRLNYFRMPEKYLEHDEEILREDALTQLEVEKYLPDLLKLQPNLIYE